MWQLMLRVEWNKSIHGYCYLRCQSLCWCPKQDVRVEETVTKLKTICSSSLTGITSLTTPFFISIKLALSMIRLKHIGWWSPTIIRGEDRKAIHIPNHKFMMENYNVYHWN